MKKQQNPFMKIQNISPFNTFEEQVTCRDLVLSNGLYHQRVVL